MVCEPAVSVASEQVATPVVGSAAIEQIEAPLSVKVVVPENFVLPEAPETVAVKITVWFTVEALFAVPVVSVSPDAAALTICDTELVLPAKFVSLL